MLMKRTASDVLSDAMQIIAKNTEITNFKAGAIARAIVEALSSEYEKLYDFMEEVLHAGFLSRADQYNSQYLDLIGELFNYPRRKETVLDEQTGRQIERLIDDKTYKYEISKQVLVAANANYEALRLACMAVPGVGTIFGKEYTRGTGSFSFYIVPLYGFSPQEVKRNVEIAIENVKAYGIRPTVVLPIEVPLEMKIQLIFKNGVQESEKEKIRFDVKTKLYNHIGNYTMGEGLIYNDIVQEIMNVDDKILDFTVVSFYLQNEPVLLMNQEIADDERIRPQYIQVV